MDHVAKNIIGYVPIPLGLAGPLLIDGKYYQIPMATTEGTLVASTNRGCTALSKGKRCIYKSFVGRNDQGSCFKFFQVLFKQLKTKEWVGKEENFTLLKSLFDSTSRFAKLQNIKCTVAARHLFMRFLSQTGDAMGMNMLSKGSEKALKELLKPFS